MAAACEHQLVETSNEVAPTVNERVSPRVKKFAGNIYSEEYFKDSVYYDNLAAFW